MVAVADRRQRFCLAYRKEESMRIREASVFVAASGDLRGAGKFIRITRFNVVCDDSNHFEDAVREQELFRFYFEMNRCEENASGLWREHVNRLCAEKAPSWSTVDIYFVTLTLITRQKSASTRNIRCRETAGKRSSSLATPRFSITGARFGNPFHACTQI